jgi:hypothetical protein
MIHFVIPAKAGIRRRLHGSVGLALDSRLRGNDDARGAATC